MGRIEKKKPNNNGETRESGRERWSQLTVIKIRKIKITNLHWKLHLCPLFFTFLKHKYMGICVQVKRCGLLK
jgi:hypothetical protein